MRFIVMFVTAVCVLFLIKLRWPKKKSLYEVVVRRGILSTVRKKIERMHLFCLVLILFSLVEQVLPQLVIA